MTIDKISTKSWRAREMINGKRYSTTFDHKPTIKEASAAIQEKLQIPENKLTLREAAEKYVEDRKNVISPSTVRGYKKLIRCIPEQYHNTMIFNLTSADLQAIVNEYAPDHSHKSVKNLSCFISSILRDHDIRLRAPSLPQKEAKEIYIPTEEDVKKIFNFLKGTKYEVPITLAALGLRRSEICALTLEDLNGNILTINKAIVQGDDGEWHIKSTKTTASCRTIAIPSHIADKIREQGYVYDGYISKIYYHLQCACDACGIPRFPAHKLRHFYASYMHDLGYTDAQIAELGGWKDSSRVMKQIYRHAMGIEEAAQSMADDIDSLF